MTTPMGTTGQAAQVCAAILDELERAVVGRRRTLELVLIGILAGGHVLLEDLPGLGKTLIARSFARVLGLDFARIQFTPDLLPSDVVGAILYDQRSAEMVFRPGPVFTQLLLADEINRTPPKTQAALLEAMGEGQVSVDGQTRKLPEPFIVLATDNPIEYEGSRSGVNWMRANSSPSTRANDRAMSVLPRPGRSSSRTWPPARMPISTSSRVRRRPTTARSSSSRIAVHVPAVSTVLITVAPIGR